VDNRTGKIGLVNGHQTTRSGREERRGSTRMKETGYRQEERQDRSKIGGHADRQTKAGQHKGEYKEKETQRKKENIGGF
jgi:hypothetical protein